VKLHICRLANIIGSAAFILVDSFIAVASAETPVERGSYLVNSIGACGHCHGRDVSGKPGDMQPDTLAGGFIFDEVDPDFGHVIAPNITPDKDTGIGNWSENDITFALRNGKRPDGSTIGPPMPIVVYRLLSDEDATAIAAYLLSAKPVTNKVEKSQYKVPMRDYGPFVTHVDAVSPSNKVAYGGYLVALGDCVVCHTPPGADKPFNMDLAFAGGRPFPTFSGIPATTSRNITPDPDQGLGKWTDDQIKDAITKAVRPDGTKLTGPMAFDFYAKITPADLDAIVAFMRTIKPVKTQ
jgi:mono/diheme cytochrome c family protein